MENNNRVQWVDLLKGSAILWLIIFHMHVFKWMHSPVPVFFFLSGLFYSDSKGFFLFIKKKANALLVPLFFFFVLGVSASALKCMLLNEDYTFPSLWLFTTMIPSDSKISNPMGVGAIWFLASLFEIYIIYYGLRMLSKNKWWLLVMGVLLFLISIVVMQFYAHGSMFYLFYTFGFCIFFIVAHQLRDKVLYGKIPIWLIYIAVLIYILRILCNIDLLNSHQNEGMVLIKIIWLLSYLGLIVILVWLCKVFSSFKFISESNIYNFMLYEGRNSLTILGIHMLVMGVAGMFLKCMLPVSGFYHMMLFLIVVIVCNICVVLFNRYVPFLVNHKTVKSK